MDNPGSIATALRDARKAKKLSISALAAQSGVSPRLIGEFERGKRPNVSLDTALRLLAILNVRVALQNTSSARRDTATRAERAAIRRLTWVGHKGTVVDQDPPQAPDTRRGRLLAVAQASRFAVGLQRAHRKAR